MVPSIFVPTKHNREIDARRNHPSLFGASLGKVGVAASKNSQGTRAKGGVHRSGTSIYRKKIDTQKVYMMADLGVAWPLGSGANLRRGPRDATLFFSARNPTSIACPAQCNVLHGGKGTRGGLLIISLVRGFFVRGGKQA